MTILIKKIINNAPFWVGIWLLWMGAIFAFSHMPGSATYYEPSWALLIERKGAHVVEYAVLFLLSTQVFSFWFQKASLKKIMIISLVWSLTYAISDELHQFFTPYRGASLRDVAIDLFGILLVFTPLYLKVNFQKKENSSQKK